ncbi:MAG: Hsp20/alpha crystallin family protein [Candidatus Pacebacteria bacterium]|nr:Hsp20/alpha crystallin family protein [Candidatus Paceibacterota bacterium]
MDKSYKISISEKSEVPQKHDSEIGQLTIDVHQTPDEIVIESMIAGINPDELRISANKDSVTIKGVRERKQKEERKNYLYQETYYGEFSRTVFLPEKVSAKNATAEYEDGALTIRLPKIK